jgi:transposase
LEIHLKKRFGELFELKYDVILYDLTSTYFEGEANGNPQAKRGHSRDHRSDCKQVIIALIVSEEGFPLTYEVFDGNIADVTTLDEITATVERKYGKSGRIWIFDRGIVSEDNLKILKGRQAQYLVGTRKDQLKNYEKELLEGDWDKVRKDVEVKLIPDEANGETYILCRAKGRNLKEKAMRESSCRKLDLRLNKLATRIEKGRLKDSKKIERRIGAILGRFPSVADIYEVAFTNGKLQITVLKEKKSWKEAKEGTYLLRTNISEKDPGLLWEKYIQLTEAEGAFRALKSELSIRPVFHQLEKRVQAHIMVAFLGYALWVTIKHTLKRTLPDYSPARVLSILKTIHSGDILLDTVEPDDRTRRTIRLRKIFSPDTEQRSHPVDGLDRQRPRMPHPGTLQIRPKTLFLS